MAFTLSTASAHFNQGGLPLADRACPLQDLAHCLAREHLLKGLSALLCCIVKPLAQLKDPGCVNLFSSREDQTGRCRRVLLSRCNCCHHVALSSSRIVMTQTEMQVSTI